MVYCVERQYRPESSPRKIPDSNMVPENLVIFSFLNPPMNKKMIDRAIRPAKFRQNEIKSPGASIKRAKAPMPPINEDEQNIMMKPMSLYLACWFIAVPLIVGLTCRTSAQQRTNPL